MSGWMQVARRELEGRRIIWPVALALGLAALGTPLIFPSDSRPATAAIVSLLFSAFVAFGVGGAMIGGELAERRLSFYFTRPLSGGAIFAGKLAAAALLVYGAQLLIWTPTVIADSQLKDATLPFAGLLALVTPLLLALGLVAGVVARCRSRWLLASATLALALVALVAFLAFEGIFVWELGWLSAWGGVLLIGGTVGGVTVALLAGAAAAIIRGRTDPLRAHRAMTIVAALALLPVGSGAYAASRRLLRPRLADVVSVHVAAAAPAGGWLHLSGSLNPQGYGAEPDFFFDTTTGQSERIGLELPGVAPVFAPDGARAASVELANVYDAVVRNGHLAADEQALVVRRLGQSGERRAEVGVAEVTGLGWSPDGRLLAIVFETEAELRNAETLHLIARARARTGTRFSRALFVSPTRLRLFASDDSGADVSELGADTRSVTAGAHLDMKGVLSDLDASPDGERVLAQESDGVVRLWTLGDGAARALETQPLRQVCGGFLPDGRIVVAHGSAQSAAQVDLFSRTGERQHTIELGVGDVSCLVTSQRVLVALDAHPGSPRERQRLWLVDADGGTARALDARLRIILPTRNVIAPARPTRLLIGDVAGSLVELDPLTTKTRLLLPGHVR